MPTEFGDIMYQNFGHKNETDVARLQQSFCPQKFPPKGGGIMRPAGIKRQFLIMNQLWQIIYTDP